LPPSIILAGPNSAGKTGFASSYLKLEAPFFVFVNADEIAA
jgi:predicted ABC-type ATPase